MAKVNCEERNGSMRHWSPGIKAHSYPDQVHQIGPKEAKQTVTKKQNHTNMQKSHRNF